MKCGTFRRFPHDIAAATTIASRVEYESERVHLLCRHSNRKSCVFQHSTTIPTGNLRSIKCYYMGEIPNPARHYETTVFSAFYPHITLYRVRYVIESPSDVFTLLKKTVENGRHNAFSRSDRSKNVFVGSITVFPGNFSHGRSTKRPCKKTMRVEKF